MGEQLTKQLVVVSQDTFKNTQMAEKVALFDSSGQPILIVQTTAAMVLTGYTLGASTAALSATDTVNQALSKLEKRIAVLEAL